MGDILSMLGGFVVTPQREEDAVLKAVEEARSRCDLVLIHQSYADVISAHMPRLIQRTVPPLLTLPDMDTPENIDVTVISAARRALGINRP